MAGFGDVFGKESAAYQLFVWSIASQVIQALAAPAFTDLQTAVNAAHPVMPLSAAEAATAANRAFMAIDAAAAEAAKQGIDADRFAVLRHLAGTAPAPEELAAALRRGVIPADGTGAGAVTFAQGIAEGNLLDKWGPVIQALAKQWPTPADILRATLQGQETIEQGRADYERVGGDPEWFQLMFDAEGSAPTPLEASEMAERGIIPWDGTGPQAVSFAQAFLEGPWRDKWQDAYRQLARYYPTASEVVELYRWGQLDVPAATSMLTQRGLDAQQAAWWIAYADANAIDDYRGLTEQAILAMLSISYISDDQARTMLAAIHKGPAAIDQLIAYGHIQRAIQSVNQAVSRVGNLYQARKITAATATDALTRLGVGAVAIPDIIADWDAVASINVRTLTEAQVVDAWDKLVLDDSEALQELQNIGYTPFDAWVLLSTKAGAPLPGRPEQGPGAALGAVAPGTT